MTTPKLHPDLSAFLCCLSEHRVRFLVIGAHVLATLGRPRYTDDLDLWVEPTKPNAKRLAEALDAFGYRELAAQAAEHFAVRERMATLGRKPVAIDILTSTPGIRFETAYRNRRVVVIGGKRIGFLGLADFIRTKRATGRPKDLLDIELLREIGLPSKTKAIAGRRRGKGQR
jgi:predicted nucleotidyltransferase